MGALISSVTGYISQSSVGRKRTTELIQGIEAGYDYIELGHLSSEVVFARPRAEDDRSQCTSRRSVFSVVCSSGILHQIDGLIVVSPHGATIRLQWGNRGEGYSY